VPGRGKHAPALSLGASRRRGAGGAPSALALLDPSGPHPGTPQWAPACLIPHTPPSRSQGDPACWTPHTPPRHSPGEPAWTPCTQSACNGRDRGLLGGPELDARGGPELWRSPCHGAWCPCLDAPGVPKQEGARATWWSSRAHPRAAPFHALDFISLCPPPLLKIFKGQAAAAGIPIPPPGAASADARAAAAAAAAAAAVAAFRGGVPSPSG